MNLHEISELDETERKKLEHMAEILSEVVHDLDAVLKKHSLDMRFFSFELTHNDEESLASRVPSPSGIGLSSEGRYVSSASFK